MVWQKVDLQKSCGAKECRKSPLVWFICLKEFHCPSSRFQILPDIKDQENKFPPPPLGQMGMDYENVMQD